MKWGDSPALRIPADAVRLPGLREGPTVEARLTVDDGPSLPSMQCDRKAFALRSAA